MFSIRLVPDWDDEAAIHFQLLKSSQLGGRLMCETITDSERKTR
jgi:hypothetical protein